MLQGWALFGGAAALGLLGLWLAYKRNWAAIVSPLATLTVTGFAILKMRDPLSLAPQYRAATQTWDYILVLFWSSVVGLTLPIFGLYLRSRARKTLPQASDRR